MQKYHKYYLNKAADGEELTFGDLVAMLSAQGADMEELLDYAGKVKSSAIGEGIYLRGLIEYSNICRKDCFYCGIRRSNTIPRYVLTENEVLECARFAYENNYGSVVIQGGEIQTSGHIETIARLVREIKDLSRGELGITLSLGEQTREAYRQWFESGAHRYLLRIETSNELLYKGIHPDDSSHSYSTRLRALEDLRAEGFQVGTGVMIGLPGQTVEDLARDLLFMRETDIDMCGMGPYIESAGTPLAGNGTPRISLRQRYMLALKMVACLRIIMPDINIAATTALQAIDPKGRMKAIEAGANVIMPNLTPDSYRADYFLYDNKPMSFDSKILEKGIRYGEWGDSKHFDRRAKDY